MSQAEQEAYVAESLNRALDEMEADAIDLSVKKEKIEK